MEIAKLALILGFSLVVALCFSAGGWAADPAPKALFEKKCSKCHSLDRIQRTETKENWTSIVSRMKGKFFSGISDEDAKIITQYLIENKGK